MVWYIRFLKPPKLDQKGRVRALITVTTDLGDAFYHADITLHAMIMTAKDENYRSSAWQSVKWKSGMRNLWIDIADANAAPPENLRLIVNFEQSKKGNMILLGEIPEILGVWSDTFSKENIQAGSMVERRYRTDSGPERAIMEESGESIARHIWDAGVVLTAFLNSLMLQPKGTSELAMLLRRSTPYASRILELGSGCGIVGLQVADLCPTSEVFLTDLPDAMDILNYNVEHARSYSKSISPAAAILDWDKPLPENIAKQRFDLVIVSDCTYNSDSIPGLVRTLRSVVKISPGALIVISLKRRHDSEAIFFDLMANAQFIEVEHTAVPLPDRHRRRDGQELEVVEVYVYRSHGSIECG